MNSRVKSTFSKLVFFTGILASAASLSTESAQASLHSLGAYKVEFKDEQGFTPVENIWGIRLSLTAEPSLSSGLATNIGVYDMELNDVHFEFDQLRSQTKVFYDGRKKWISEVPEAKWISALPFKEIHHPENKVDGYQIGFKYEISGVKQIQYSYFLVCDRRMFHLKALVPEDMSVSETAKIDKIVASFRCEKDSQNVAGHDRGVNQKNWKDILNDPKKSQELPSIFREFLINYEVAHSDDASDEEASRSPVQNFIERYLSPRNAYADNSECFFAGWTSAWQKNDQGVMTCAEPKGVSNCGAEQIQCNPAAFGQVCIERTFKQSATQVCNSTYERNAQKHDQEILQFLEKSPKALNELASAADHLCEEKPYQLSNYGLCSALYSRLDDLKPAKDGDRHLEPPTEIGVKTDDYQRAFEVTQDEAQLFENVCLADDHQSMLASVQANHKFIDCIKLKERLLHNLKSLDQLDSKTNFKVIEESTCAVDATTAVGKSMTGTVAALRNTCSPAEKAQIGNCGADILCAAVPSLGFLPPIAGLNNGSCHPVKDNCAVHAVTGIIEALWSTVKGLASLAGHAVTGIASDTYRVGKNTVKGDLNLWFGTTYAIDNASSYKTVSLAKSTADFVSKFMHDPSGLMKSFMNSIMSGVADWLKGDVFCQKWEGIPHMEEPLGKCVQKATTFECTSCKTIINGSCTALGYVASEIIGTLLTGGAKGALDAAGVTGKVARMLGKAGELGKLKYARFAEEFPEAARLSKVGASRAGSAAKVTGKIIGGAGKAVLFPAKYLVGKAGKLITFLEKIPVAGKAFKTITFTGEKANQFGKWYGELNRKAFSLGERGGGWAVRRASRASARAEAATLEAAASGLAVESAIKGAPSAKVAVGAKPDVEQELSQLQKGRDKISKQLETKKPKTQRKKLNAEIQTIDQKIAVLKKERAAAQNSEKSHLTDTEIKLQIVPTNDHRIVWKNLGNNDLNNKADFESFRKSFHEGKLEGDARYISFIDSKTGNRLIAKTESIGADGKTLRVRKASGEDQVLTENELQSVKMDQTSKLNIGLSEQLSEKRELIKSNFASKTEQKVKNAISNVRNKISEVKNKFSEMNANRVLNREIASVNKQVQARKIALEVRVKQTNKLFRKADDELKRGLDLDNVIAKALKHENKEEIGIFIKQRDAKVQKSLEALQEQLSLKGIHSEIKTEVHPLLEFDLSKSSDTPVVRALKKLSGERKAKRFTVDPIYDREINAGGFWQSGDSRLEMGWESAKGLVNDELGQTLKHEGRHVKFTESRYKKIDDLYNGAFHGSSSVKLNESGIYDSYMTLEEVYNHIKGLPEQDLESLGYRIGHAKTVAHSASQNIEDFLKTDFGVPEIYKNEGRATIRISIPDGRSFEMDIFREDLEEMPFVRHNSPDIVSPDFFKFLEARDPSLKQAFSRDYRQVNYVRPSAEQIKMRDELYLKYEEDRVSRILSNQKVQVKDLLKDKLIEMKANSDRAEQAVNGVSNRYVDYKAGKISLSDFKATLKAASKEVMH